MVEAERASDIAFLTTSTSRDPARIVEMLRLIALAFVDSPELAGGEWEHSWTATASEIAEELERLLGPELSLSRGQVIVAFSSYLGLKTRAAPAYAKKLRHLLRKAVSTPQFAIWLREQAAACRRALSSAAQDGVVVTDEGITCRKGGRVLWRVRGATIDLYQTDKVPPLTWRCDGALLTAVVKGGERAAAIQVIGEHGERAQTLVLANAKRLPYRCTGGTWLIDHLGATSWGPRSHALVLNAHYIPHYPSTTCVTDVTAGSKPLRSRWRLWSSGRAHRPLLASRDDQPLVLVSGILNVLFCHHPSWPVLGKDDFVGIVGSPDWSQPAPDVQSFDGRAGPGLRVARWRWLWAFPPVPTLGRSHDRPWRDGGGCVWACDGHRVYSFHHHGALRSTAALETLFHWFGPALSHWISERFLGGLRGQVVAVPQFDEPRDGYEWFCRYFEETYIAAVEEMADWVKAHWRDVQDEPFAEHWKPWLARARACKLPPYDTYISFEDKG